MAFARTAEDLDGQVNACQLLGSSRTRGDLAAAPEHARHAVQIAPTAGNPFGPCNALLLLAQLTAEDFEIEEARYYAEQSLAAARAHENRLGEGNAHLLLTEAELLTDDRQAARVHLKRALELAEETGNVVGAVQARAGLPACWPPDRSMSGPGPGVSPAGAART